MVFGNVECSVLGWVGGGRGAFTVLEQFPHEGANLLFESWQIYANAVVFQSK